MWKLPPSTLIPSTLESANYLEIKDQSPVHIRESAAHLKASTGFTRTYKLTAFI